MSKAPCAISFLAFAILAACGTHAKTTENAALDSSVIDAGEIVDASLLDSSTLAVGSDSGGWCPPEMILVEGDYCPKVVQNCKRWLDTGRFADYRCAEYVQPTRCISAREKKALLCRSRGIRRAG